MVSDACRQLMAYLRTSTHPGVFEAPLAPDDAVANVSSLLALPHVQAPGEQDAFWRHFRAAASDGGVRGNLVSDAHVVALMRENGARTIWSHDRDYRRFRGIDVLDPFE